MVLDLLACVEGERLGTPGCQLTLPPASRLEDSGGHSLPDPQQAVSRVAQDVREPMPSLCHRRRSIGSPIPRGGMFGRRGEGVRMWGPMLMRTNRFILETVGGCGLPTSALRVNTRPTRLTFEDRNGDSRMAAVFDEERKQMGWMAPAPVEGIVMP